MNYEIFDDYISKLDQLRILQVIGEENFPWFYNEHTLYEVDKNIKNDKPQMIHSFVHNCTTYEGDQNFYQFLKGVLPFPEWDTHEIYRCKFNLNLPLRNTKVITPHLDTSGNFREIIVYLYYVNDSDGSTRIWPNIHTNGEWEEASSRNLTKYFPIKVQPKQGRVLRMSTNIWHSSDVPKKSKKRIVGNFVFVKQ